MEQFVTAKLFKNGNSQAVRLPKEFRFEGKEVLITRHGKKVILQAKAMRKKSPAKSKSEWINGWEEFFASPPLINDDYMKNVSDPPPEQRDFF